MTNTENTTEPDTSGQHPPSGMSVFHPLAQATAAVYMCLHPVSAEADMQALADELGRMLIADNVDDIDAMETILAGQTRVMNAAFTRLMLHAFPYERHPNIDVAKAAFIAQRQCAHTIDRFKKHKKAASKLKGHE